MAAYLAELPACERTARVVVVRQRYSLTIDQREADALDQVLAGCASTELITFARGEVPAPATSSVRVPEAIAALGRQPERPRQSAPKLEHTGSHR